MGFFRDGRCRRVRRRASLDEALWARVASRLSYLRGLSKEEAARLRELVVLFLAEKEMHGAHGFRLTDEVRLSIAAQACLPILNLGLDVYNGWVGVVVYPGEFRVRKEEMDEHGIVHTFDEELAGEAWPGGPAILSWAHPRPAHRPHPAPTPHLLHNIHPHRPGPPAFPRRRAGTHARDSRRPPHHPYRGFCSAL